MIDDDLWKPADHWDEWLDHLENHQPPHALPFNPSIREIIEGYQEVVRRLVRDVEGLEALLERR